MLRTLRDYLRIKRSGWFDAGYYLLKYPDVRRADVDPIWHYLKIGWREGRYPSGKFEQVLAENAGSLAPDCNPLVGFLQNERTQLRKPGIGLKEISRFLYKGFIFFINLKGIVFFGGYPYPERERDGYYQRIRSVDTIFADRWRVYVDRVCLAGRDAWYDFPAPKTLVIRVDESRKRKWLVGFCAGLCVLRTGVIYFHSVLALGGVQYLMRLPGIRKVIDIHGVVPEEFRYQGDPGNGELFDRVERAAVEHADHVIVVSDAMRRHLEEKYPGGVRGKFIVLPILQKVPADRFKKPSITGKPVIIYSGGLQKWQQVPKMIDAIQQTAQDYEYRFYCPAPQEVLAMLPENLRSSPSIVVGSKPPEEIFPAYRECHYGFILREDIIVNRVACPTKLMEYLAADIIPIVDSEEIGDFKEMGMQYIHLADLLNHSLPDEASRQIMADRNFGVYEKLLEKYGAGVAALQQSIKRGII